MISIEEQIKIICKGANEVIELDELRKKLEKAINEGRQLIAKLGLDPSAPDIHIGHAVVLRKLRQIQDLGHKVIIIIGDFTGMIGDPTGKSKTRNQLSKEEVLKNAKTYEDQIFKVLDKSKTEVKFNSQWLSKLNFTEVINLCSKYTVARMLEREDFKNRFSSHLQIGIHEFFYPLMQAYDSIAINADIELGGTDQRFNILMGRTMQKEYGQESQIALFMPILEGTDGKDKMSKSLGNYIGINESPSDIYGKVMSIPDELIIKYYELATDIHPDVIENIKKAFQEQIGNPRDVKMNLAKEIVSLYHGVEASNKAEEYFKNVFQKKETPEDIEAINISKESFNNGKIGILSLILESGFAPSKKEARRLIEQGGVKINGQKIISVDNHAINEGDVLQVGKMKFGKIQFI